MKRLIKYLFNAFGLDIIRLNKSPQYSLLGLKNLGVKTIIDIGANEGQFAKMISKFFPKAKLYCFEPLSEQYKKLEFLAHKMEGRLKAFNLALGEEEGFIEMFYHKEHSPSSSILKTTKACEDLYPFTKEQESVQAKISTLDKCVNDFNIALEPEVLIKLDVQGYENRVIRGGMEILKKAKACIIEVSLDSLYEGQTNFRILNEMLYNLGFHYAGNLNQTYSDDGHVIFIDAVFVKE